MKKILIYSGIIFLWVHTAFANNGTPGPRFGFYTKYKKAPLRFATYASYSKYQSLKAFKGPDSANAFYKEAFKKTVYTDPVYLPLTAGSSYPLTGTLYGTNLNFSGSGSFVNDFRITGDDTGKEWLTLTNSTGSRSFKLLTGIDNVSNTGFSIYDVTNSAVRMVISNSGNIGIGTSTPAYKLEVNGNFRTTGGGHVNFLSTSAGSGDGLALMNDASDATKIQLYTNGDSYLNGGNIGIGTTSPGQPLHVRSTSTSLPKLKVTDGGLSSWMGSGRSYDNPIIAFGDVGGITEAANPVNVQYGWSISSIYNGDFNVGRKAGSSSWSDAFTIQRSTGNVGIGTTTPTISQSGGALHISGPNAGLRMSAITSGGWAFTEYYDYNNTGQYITGFRSANNTFNIVAGTSLGSGTGIVLNSSGNVGIGTAPTSDKLAVNGYISAKKITVTQLGWSDYVFAKDYKLRSLQSLESFINQYKHLPEVPTTKEVEAQGISVGDNQALLLKKIEEVTLYIIAQQRQIANLIIEIKRLKTKK